MGPLQGFKIIEFAGIGPGPFCAMMLADMGADVIRLERKTKPKSDRDPRTEILHRGRRSVAMDLKNARAIEAVLKMIEGADAILEGFRPGVMERLGLGPDVCLARNPRLVYGRMTGWGQDGPLAQAAGHDINYIAITGALHSIGRTDQTPVPPLNLVGDFGGGGMLLAFGMACALCETQRSGRGQVVDAAMVDGASALMAMFYGFRAAGMWSDRRGTNHLDGGSHYYDTYECRDGRYISIGSIEPQFYALLLEKAGLDDPDFQVQSDRERWARLKEKLVALFKTRTRDEWCEIMEGTDVCFGPVLTLEEAPNHPHNAARKTFIDLDGVVQPAPAPRFSRTVPQVQGPPPAHGQHTRSALADWGFDPLEIEDLAQAGVI
ncbi:MAG: CoA transferase [Proteobacteria bacterium]|nr:CoA transferase [Pseudomonadota bacterium]